MTIIEQPQGKAPQWTPAPGSIAKTNEQKILWWVRFIGIVTMLGLMAGAWFSITAIVDEINYNKCVEDSYSSSAELRCALER